MSATEFYPKKLKVEELDGEYRKLCEPFDFIVGGFTISVPVGFITDYASIPKVLHWFVSPNTYKRAAVAHDFLYATGKTTRLEADAVFQGLLVKEGCPPWKAWVMYLALRAAGWKAWNEHRHKR